MAEGLSALVVDPRPAINGIRDYVTGANVDILEAIHCGLDLESYALGQFHKHPITPTMHAAEPCESSKDCAKKLLACCEVKGADTNEAGILAGVDWATVFALTMQLISLLIAKK